MCQVLVIGGCPRLGKTTVGKSVASSVNAYLVHGDAVMASLRSVGSLPARIPTSEWGDQDKAWMRTAERNAIVTKAMASTVQELIKYTGYETVVTEGAYVPGMTASMLAGVASVAEIVIVNTDGNLGQEVERLHHLNENDPKSWLRRYDNGADGLKQYAKVALYRNLMVKKQAEEAGIRVFDLVDYGGDIAKIEQDVGEAALRLIGP